MNPSPQEKRVLVVDDEALLAKIVKKHLEAEGGFTVQVELRSAQALQTAQEFKPDIVLLDIVMPEMDGHAVAETLHSHSETAHIPILYISAMTSNRFELGQFSKTEDGFFLAKPFMRKDLLTAIKTTLESAQL